MKLNREQITAIFGSAPSKQEGMKLVGMKNGPPLQGQRFYSGGEWHIASYDYSGTRHPVAIFEDVAQPTTLEDLVGKDGQKNFYLHVEDGMSAGRVSLYDGESLEFKPMHMDGACTIEHYIENQVRWCNSPFTPYADANEFKGGHNE